MFSIGKKMADRISVELTDKELLQDRDIFKKIARLFSIWNKYGDSNKVSEFIKTTLGENPSFVIDLLEGYLGTSWDSDGISKKSDFERMEYDSIIKIIDPKYLALAISKLYGAIPLDKDYPSFIELPFKEKLVRQFLWIHNFVVNEKKEVK